MFSRKTILVILILAMGAAGFTAAGRWRNSTQEPGRISQPVPILERRVTSIQLVSVPAKEAFSRIQSSIGIQIKPDWTSMIAHRVDPNHPLTLDLKNVTVGEVMEGVVDQLRSYTDAAGYTVEGDTIIVAPNVYLKRTLVIYDIRDLPLTKDVADELEGPISFGLQPNYWNCHIVRSAQAKWLHRDAIRLLIVQTPETHERIRSLLNALRHANSDGTGPAFTRIRTMKRFSMRTMVCVYDVSDLVNRFEYTPPSDQQPPASLGGTYAIAEYLWYNVKPKSWSSGDGIGQFCEFGNRLIVEQIPEVHEEIRRTLGELRSRPETSIRITSNAK